jgi:hypothetical protein
MIPSLAPSVSPSLIPTNIPTATPSTWAPTTVDTHYIGFTFQLSLTSQKGASYSPSSNEKSLLYAATVNLIGRAIQRFSVAVAEVRRRQIMASGTATWTVSFDLASTSQNQQYLILNTTSLLTSSSFANSISQDLNATSVSTSSISAAVGTRNPTELPTVSPTTWMPTTIPTSSPSQIPSMIPTPRPSDVPTSSPSQIPSMIPTPYPSAVPTIHCDLGYYLDGYSCVACAVGKYAAVDTAPFATSCNLCPAGKYQSQSASYVCNECDVGKVKSFFIYTYCCLIFLDEAVLLFLLSLNFCFFFYGLIYPIFRFFS